jgi:hypothetical protein
MNHWIIEHFLNDNDTGETEKLKNNLSELHFVHHKSHMHWPGNKHGYRAVNGRLQTETWHVDRELCGLAGGHRCFEVT